MSERTLPRTLEEYERSLEIARQGEVPELAEADVTEITKTVFIPSEPKPAEVLFIFGTAQAEWDGMAQAVRAGKYQRVITTGLIGKLYFERNQPLAHTMRDELVARGVDEGLIQIQDRSTHTLEDVTFSLDLLCPQGQKPQGVTFHAKAHHSGRCLRSLRRFLSQSAIHAWTFPAYYSGVRVDAETWPGDPVARARVYSEYLRIKTYSARGDIAP
jgi:hypothetical protein